MMTRLILHPYDSLEETIEKQYYFSVGYSFERIEFETRILVKEEGFDLEFLLKCPIRTKNDR